MDSKRDSNDLEFSKGESSLSSEHSRLIDDYNVSPPKERSTRYGRIVFILSLSNTICVILLLIATVVPHTGPAKCIDPDTMHYPEKPKWFPPESKLSFCL